MKVIHLILLIAGFIASILFSRLGCKKIGDVAGLRVLDIGCGSGRSSRLLAEAGAMVTGVDNSQPMLDLAIAEEEKNTLGIKYIFGDMSDLPVIDGGEFDLVAGAMILHYAKTEEEMAAYMRSIGKNLKAGGRLVLINSNPDNAYQELHPFLGFSTCLVGGGEPTNGSETRVTFLDNDGKAIEFSNYYWKKEIYNKILSEAGFENIEWTACHASEDGRKIFNADEAGLSLEEVEKMMVLCLLSAVKK